MVTDFLIDWVNSILNAAVDTLPDDTMGVDLGLGWISDMNYFIPIGEMFGVFVIFFALGGPFIASSLVIWWVVGILRGGATKA